MKLGGGCMTIMERMALRLEGPTFSLHTSRGTSTACAICTHTHTRMPLKWPVSMHTMS